MTGARWALAWIALVIGCVATMRADAEPASVEWVNPADESYGPSIQALLCPSVNGGPCSWIETVCAPGATCAATFDLPAGTYEDARLWVRGIDPNLWSTVSPPIPSPLVVESLPGGECVHDANGDGAVTTSDFLSFQSEFIFGCSD